MAEQQSLFSHPNVGDDANSGESIVLEGAELKLFPQWLSPDQQAHYFDRFQRELAWEQSILTMYGREQAIPRLNAWYGDPECHYGYSGHQLALHTWTESLQQLRQRLEKQFNHTFNSVLANLYRDGRDSVGWHADDEPELGRRPVIASISLGATRTMKFQPKGGGAVFSLELAPGSLLLMSGDTQHNWRHAILKTHRIIGPRINLTFRRICPDLD